MNIEHLVDDIAALPDSPGVYFFMSESDFPLYIGKSVNIRRRVMSHLRNHDARFLTGTRHISYTQTVGEIGALLLESSLIKQMKPLYNKQLRKTRRLCSLHVDETATRIVYSDEVNFSQQNNLYGLFKHRVAATTFLRDLANQHKLCLGALGVEKLRPGQACFRHTLGRCAGVCCGKQPIGEHQARLTTALLQHQIRHWPWPGRIAIEEKQGGRKAFHVLNNWFYLGSAHSLKSAQKLQLATTEFDRDCYKILCRRLLECTESVHVLDATE